MYGTETLSDAALLEALYQSSLANGWTGSWRVRLAAGFIIVWFLMDVAQFIGWLAEIL